MFFKTKYRVYLVVFLVAVAIGLITALVIDQIRTPEARLVVAVASLVALLSFTNYAESSFLHTLNEEELIAKVVKSRWDPLLSFSVTIFFGLLGWMIGGFGLFCFSRWIF